MEKQELIALDVSDMPKKSIDFHPFPPQFCHLLWVQTKGVRVYNLNYVDEDGDMKLVKVGRNSDEIAPIDDTRIRN